MPSVVVTVAGFSLVRPKRNPADESVCLELDDAGLNGATETLQAIQSALPVLSGVSFATSLAMTSQFGQLLASASWVNAR